MSVRRRGLLDACDPDLVRLFLAVGADRNIVILQGARTISEEATDIKTGRSALLNPMDSKHVVDPILRPLSLAVDAAPDPIDWEDIAAFAELADAVKLKAAELGIAVVWGGDWVHFKDYDHWELVHAHAETL